MTGVSDDPVIRHQREQISDLDHAILALLNQRVHRVKHLKDYKEAQGHCFHDTAQETRVLATLDQANPGPLPSEGLKEIFRVIIDWSKRAAADLGDTPTD